MTKLYLMRHGETLFNTQKRVQGWCDSPLTAKGIEQAKIAHAWFEGKGIRFEEVYSSTQERACDTAKIVAPSQNVTQLKGLKEMSFGQLEAQPEMLLPKFRQGARSFEDLLVPFGGEDIYQVGHRVYDTLKSVLDETEAKNLLMVSHGAALWGLIQYLDLPFPEGVRFGNCNICIYEYRFGELVLSGVVDPIENVEVAL